MKKRFAKFLGVGLALVLVLSFSLVTAVPAAAEEPMRLNLISVGVDSSAEWVDAETMAPQAPCTGAYSLKLYALDGKEVVVGDGLGGGSGVYIPVNVAIKDIESLSFSRLGNTDFKDAKVNLLIDADNDGDLDFTPTEALEYHRIGGDTNFFGEDAMIFLNPTDLIDTDTWATVDAYTTYYCWGTDQTGKVYTSSDPEGLSCGVSLGVANGYQVESAGSIDPTDKVLGVIVLFGCGSGVADRSVYIDDIEMNGTTYDLEPSGALGMTAAFVPTIGISVNPTFVDFGAVAPDDPSAPQYVTVTNEGNVNADFAASIINESHQFVYTDGLEIDERPVGEWLSIDVGPGLEYSLTPELILTVPTGTAPGNYSAVLVFWATASP